MEEQLPLIGIRNERIFFSLKWSALILLSLIFIFINAFFYSYNHENLLRNYEVSREGKFQQNKTQLESLINQTSLNVLQIAEIIPSLPGFMEIFSNNDPEKFKLEFEKLWEQLEFQSQINGISFVKNNESVIHHWGDRISLDAFAVDIGDSETKLIHDLDLPLFKTICELKCALYGFVPLMIQGKKWGSIVVTASLLDTIKIFSDTAKIDVALLYSNATDNKTEINALKSVDSWGVNLMNLSHFNEMHKVIDYLSRIKNFDSIKDSLTRFTMDEKTYEIFTYRLSQSNSVYIGYIEDVSDAIAAIGAVTREYFLTGVAALFFSEVALLIVLWRPLSKLRHASDIIPLLAQNAFGVARNAITKLKPGRFIKNEIDILDENIIEVSYQLERLQKNVDQYTASLADRMKDLTSERDFIQSLLDTAQVLIIIHDSQGNIKKVNKYIRDLTQFNEKTLLKTNIFQLVTSSSDSGLLKQDLHKIARGEITQLRKESLIKCKTGEIRYIEWFHTRLETTGSGTPNILSVGLDLTERKAYEEEISWLADHDSLTGLLNRRRFQTLLSNTINSAKRYGNQVALLFLDLDNFKQLNDTLGHQTGDMLIKSAAANLKLILRESDYIARFGGDEFAIILPRVSEEGAIDVANKINKCLSSLRISDVTVSHRATTSIGIAMFPAHGVDDKELLANADLAMYQAKSKGKGCWHLYSRTDDIRKRFESQMYWRNKINNALRDGLFELFYQPIVDLKNHSISHYEALIRMIDDDGNIILPTPFIAVAEKTGLINEIDHYVLTTSIRHIAMKNKSGIIASLAINLSAHSFGDDKLFELLNNLLQAEGISPSQLIFEITETAALSDLSGAAELIKQIRSLGCKFALDDFGVGFSSFYYLKELPVDYVKIDGSFIQKLPENRNDQILVKAITDIARESGKKVIAEFVENEATMQLLKKYKVDYAQGYYLGLPERKVA